MKLGIINDWSEDGFRYVKEKGLEAIEFCVNYYSDSKAFLEKAPQIAQLSKKYGIPVGSTGRWGATRLEKLAKLYPDRKIALNTKKAKDARSGSKSSGASVATAQPAQKKSLRERAMMNAELQETEEETEKDEAAEAKTDDTKTASEES